MNFRLTLFACFAAVATLAGASIGNAAVPPSESYFPTTTKLYVSSQHPATARERFDATQLGKLVNDPKMEKFNADLEKQLAGDGRLAERLGVSVAELEEVYGGEIAMAVIRPVGEENGYATALVIDVTGKIPETMEMLKKIQARRLKSGGACAEHFFDKQKGIAFAMPKKGKQPAYSTYITFGRVPVLIFCDHQKEAHAIFDRIEGKRKDALVTLPAFSGSMAEVAKASGDLKPDVRWFLEPFGYMRLRRSEQIDAGTREPPERGRDDLDIYADEGFDAIQGVGGWINFGAGGNEILHRSFVYAPAVDRTKKDELTQYRLKIEGKATPAVVKYSGPDNDKYFLGARMLNFPNEGNLKPLDWIPNDVAAHLTFHWPMQKAFKYSETLVNALSREVEDQSMWVGTLDSIRDDDDGPKVDIRKDIAAQMGERVTFISDYLHPIDTKCERTVLAMEISGDVAAVTKAVNDMMADDPDAVEHKVGDHIIWEMITRPEGEERRPRRGRDDEEERAIPNSAITVAHGHLLRGSHVDIVQRLLATPKKGDELASATDLKQVNAALDKLSDGKESFRYFERLDRTVEPHWVLIGMGKFTQAETMLADLVAQMQGFDPEDPATRKRPQEISGVNLPKFDFAKPFLGPAGLFVKSQPNGWLITGAVLTKE